MPADFLKYYTELQSTDHQNNTENAETENGDVMLLLQGVQLRV
jgi:hypothetical protein